MAMATNLKRLTPAMVRLCGEVSWWPGLWSGQLRLAAHGTRVLRLCGKNEQADDIGSMDIGSNERVLEMCNVYGTVG